MFNRLRAESEAKIRLAVSDHTVPLNHVDSFIDGAEWGYGQGSAVNRVFHKLCCELLEATSIERRLEVINEMKRRLESEN